MQAGKLQGNQTLAWRTRFNGTGSDHVAAACCMRMRACLVLAASALLHVYADGGFWGDCAHGRQLQAQMHQIPVAYCTTIASFKTYGHPHVYQSHLPEQRTAGPVNRDRLALPVVIRALALENFYHMRENQLA